MVSYLSRKGVNSSSILLINLEIPLGEKSIICALPRDKCLSSDVTSKVLIYKYLELTSKFEKKVL